MKSSRNPCILDFDNRGGLKVHVRNPHGICVLGDIQVTVAAHESCSRKFRPQQKPTDERGTAVFSNVPSGKLALQLSHPSFILDHVQFRGKSYADPAFTLHPSETLEILTFVRPLEARRLEEIVRELDASVTEQPPEPAIIASLKTITKMLRSGKKNRIAHVSQRFKDVRNHLEYLQSQHSRVQNQLTEKTSKIVFDKDNLNQLAVQIQEYLRLPKFVEEHPQAPEIWENCLKAARILVDDVNSRRYSIAEVRNGIRLIEDNNQKGMDLAAEIEEQLQESSVPGVSQKLQMLSSIIKTIHGTIKNIHTTLPEIDQQTRRIDYPKRISYIAKQVNNL